MPRHLRFAFLLSFTSLLVALVPLRAATYQTFVLSNEGGGLIPQLLAGGYGNENLYQALTDIGNNTNPSALSVITPNFLNALSNLRRPAPSSPHN